MPTQSFSAQAQQGEEEPKGADAPTEELATQESAPVTSLGFQSPETSGIVGEVQQSDFRIPRLNIVQKTSEELSEQFDFGLLIFNKTVPLQKEITDPVEVIIAKGVLGYQRILSEAQKKAGEQEDRVKTLEEVHAKGGSDQFGAEKRYGRYIDLMVFVKMPKDCPKEHKDKFNFPMEDGKWAKAGMFVAKTAWSSMGQELVTLGQKNQPLEKGLHYGKFTLTTMKEKRDSRVWWVPKAAFSGLRTDKQAEAISAFM